MGLLESSVLFDVGNDEAFSVQCDPSCHAFAEGYAEVSEFGLALTDRDGVVEVFAGFVEDEEGPCFRLEELLHLLHDGVQHGIEVERGRKGSREIVKDDEIFPIRIRSLLSHRQWAVRHGVP